MILRTEDHPEANGRKPIANEVEYKISMTLENGELLVVKMGQRCFDTISQLLLDMLTHAPSYDDGSLDGKKG
jgi:hypothetical protein